MGPSGLIVLSLGLAADSFAAALARGSAAARPTLRYAVIVAAMFTALQVAMPAFGWQIGAASIGWLHEIDHWIAFVLLSGLGIKMIRDGGDGVTGAARRGLPAFPALALTAAATSVDSLFAGFGLGTVGVSLSTILICIGAVTFAISLAGVLLGHCIGQRLGSLAPSAGGIALAVIGSSILIDHIWLTPAS